MARAIRHMLTQDAATLAAGLALDATTARIELQSLLQHVLGCSRAWLLAHPEQMPDELQQAAYQQLLQRRLAGEPLAYILGEREFFGLNFRVTPATLIPRSDTELLVELSLQHIAPQKICRVLDLGTGSGAIALSIAHNRPAAEVLACDVSPAALDVARENAQRLGIANAKFVRSNWFSGVGEERYDLIVSNPPYVAAGDPHLLQGDLPFEPPSALASGADGLEDIRHIVAHAHAHLRSGGWLLLEHGYDQAVPVRELLQRAGFGEVGSSRDLSGIERASFGRAQS